MVDEMLTHLETIRERPIWQPIPQEVKDHFHESLPHEPIGEEAAYQEFKQYILNYSMGNVHPRFWGWVMGNGIPYAVLADMLAAGINPNMGGGEHIPAYVERQVIDWCKEMLGYPADSSGILVSGGSMANFVGLAVARNAMAGYDIRQEGIYGSQAPMVFYASTETHSSNYKAIDLLGLGRKWLRLLPANRDYQLDLEELEAAIAADRAAGYHPACIIGNAGTTNTGAIDDLNALADIAEREGIWFHVDGAFGAMAALSDKLKGRVAGMERADSFAFDLHKWVYMPFEVACVLIRNFEDHINTFSVSPDYLSHMPRGLAAGEHAWFGDLGLQLTRGFRALKVWMTFKAYGLEKFGRVIEQNVDQADYLAGRIHEDPDFELMAGVPLNIVCFRYIKPGLDDAALDDLNRGILMELHERGLAVPSYTRLDGKFAIRVCVTNHRSTCADFDLFLEKICEIAEQFTEQVA